MTRDIRAGAALSPATYDTIVQRAILDCFKWNLSASDAPITCRYPLIISKRFWRTLCASAEALDAEGIAAERELLARPELQKTLGLPRRLASTLARAPALTVPRYTRFDFHFTGRGLRITESNCDVAGGLLECSGLSPVFAEHVKKNVTGDPAAALARSLASAYGAAARVAVAHLESCSDDRQVALYLAKRFREQGLRPVLVDPRQLKPGLPGLDALFRFFPGNWLEHLPAQSGWPAMAADPRVVNPLSTLLVQSKRFPLVWKRLRTPLPTWRSLLPETVPTAPARHVNDWVLKPAFGFEGVNIAFSGVTDERTTAGLWALARRSPRSWVMQRRFEQVPLETPDGPRYVALGVFVVDGKAAGAWARVSRTPLIDATAQEVVVLVEDSK